MMMKRLVPHILCVICASISLGGYSDGFITAGEYEYGVIWTSNTPPLIVDGGGADVIDIGGNNGELEVHSTSTPLNENWHTGGITDIFVTDYGRLYYLGGITEEITTALNATAVLKGGRIDGITSMQFATTKHIDLYCRPGWSWVGQKTGIMGQWEDGTGFNITLVNDSDYDPTWMNINIIEVPEPTTLALLALGGMLIRRKK